MRYSHEHDFDAFVDQSSAEFNVPVALIKAIIGQESGFDWKAYREEPKIGDASRGLMQLLFKTARTLGYSGSEDALFDPATNIRLGTKYLADNIRFAAANGHGIDAAISAYNAGFSAQRTGDGKRTKNDIQSPFINQDSYVQPVLEKASYFAQNAGAKLAPVVVSAPASTGGTATSGVPTTVVIGVALVFPRALPTHGQ